MRVFFIQVKDLILLVVENFNRAFDYKTLVHSQKQNRLFIAVAMWGERPSLKPYLPHPLQNFRTLALDSKAYFKTFTYSTSLSRFSVTFLKHNSNKAIYEVWFIAFKLLVALLSQRHTTGFQRLLLTAGYLLLYIIITACYLLL